MDIFEKDSIYERDNLLGYYEYVWNSPHTSFQVANQLTSMGLPHQRAYKGVFLYAAQWLQTLGSLLDIFVVQLLTAAFVAL